MLLFSSLHSLIINNESILKLFSNTHIEGGIKYITADIARLGKDKTVVMVWDGLRVIEVRELAISTITETAQLIKTLQEKYNVNLSNVLCDEDGVGGGVVVVLRCRGFVNGSKAIKIKGKEENFANLKTQCYWKLAEYINRNEIFVSCDSSTSKLLSEELEWVRLAKDLDASKISLLSKDAVKKQLGRSPDYSDSLMMRMYWSINVPKKIYSKVY